MSIDVEYYPVLTDEEVIKYLKIINENKNKWDKPFFTDIRTHINMEKIEEVARPFKNSKNVIVLGTGGSIQTLLALKHLSEKKIFPVTDSRPVGLKGCLKKTSPDDSIVIPISRGGETLDVNSTIGLFLKRGYNFLGLSSAGSMYEMLKEIKCPILDVPDLSGRFAGSISNVGIVPAYLADIGVKDFLNGLDKGYKQFLNYEKNPALELAAFLFKLYENGYKLVFSMPYSKNLEGSVGLFVQEISESTGKDEKGLMGAYQAAPLCQHSVLEYILGGTKGAVIPILWTVNTDKSDILLESSIDYVNSQSALTIVNYQADATFQALIEQSIPSVKLSVENSDEKNIGLLISFIQSTIYYICLLLNVNWANNPKVVIGKKICNEALRNKSPPEELKKKREELSKTKYKPIVDFLNKI